MQIHSADLFAMLLFGFLGTGHCIGMCGPLVFAFPGSTGRFSAHLWYHTGRLGAYVLLGALLSGIGAKLVSFSSYTISSPPPLILWMQFGLSFFAAIFMLLLGLTRFGLLKEPQWMTVASPNRIPGVNQFLRAVLKSPKDPALMVLGFIMGYIPCGLSYAAFARALPCGRWQDGALLLFMFGLGTLPGLLFLGTGLSRLFRRYQQIMDPVAGLVMIAMACRMLLKSFQALL